MNRFLNILQGICYFLVIVGAINWGLVGLFGFNLVTFIFSEGSLMEKITYITIGVAAIISLILTVRYANDLREDY